MELIVDGIIYQLQSIGGISRLFDNVLPLMCDLDPGLKVRIFHNWNLLKPTPQHKNISRLALNKWDPYFRPWRLWKNVYPKIHNLYLKLIMGNTTGKVWLSSYYTEPPFEWKGKRIVFVYDFIHELFPKIFHDSAKIINQKKRAILTADAVICISKTTAQDLVKYYPIPDLKIFEAELGIERIFRRRTLAEINRMLDFPFILYVGMRDDYKGFSTLLSCFSHWESNPKVRLVVVGPPWSPDEEKNIKEFDLQNRIVMLQGIDDNQLCDFYNQASTFVYPSLYEGFGIPLLEAMACGCPVAASQIPSTLEVAKDVPYYFAPGDSIGMMNSLNQAMYAGRSSEKIQQGIFTANQYSWNRTASKVLEVIKIVTKSN